VDQLREGAVSRLMLIGIEGAPPQRLARLSEGLTAKLATLPAFAYVNNARPTRWSATASSCFAIAIC